jgi:hypothetical protein
MFNLVIFCLIFSRRLNWSREGSMILNCWIEVQGKHNGNEKLSEG